MWALPCLNTYKNSAFIHGNILDRQVTKYYTHLFCKVFLNLIFFCKECSLLFMKISFSYFTKFAVNQSNNNCSAALQAQNVWPSKISFQEPYICTPSIQWETVVHQIAHWTSPVPHPLTPKKHHGKTYLSNQNSGCKSSWFSDTYMGDCHLLQNMTKFLITSKKCLSHVFL